MFVKASVKNLTRSREQARNLDGYFPSRNRQRAVFVAFIAINLMASGLQY